MARRHFQRIFSHDEYDNSTQKLREFMYRKHQPHLTMPLAFGPNPGPTQTFHMRQAVTPAANCVTVNFKTSRTFVRNLLTNNKCSSKGPGSVASMSLSCVSFSNVDWLGGRDYLQVGFFIHDVETTGSEGLSGSFTPIIFTNSPEVVVADGDKAERPSEDS